MYKKQNAPVDLPGGRTVAEPPSGSADEVYRVGAPATREQREASHLAVSTAQVDGGGEATGGREGMSGGDATGGGDGTCGDATGGDAARHVFEHAMRAKVHACRVHVTV